MLAICVSGCATLGRKATSPGSIAACRQLCQNGSAALGRGDHVQGEALLRRAIDANPTDADAPRRLAESLFRRSEVNDAVLMIEFAYELAPHDSSIAIRAGEMRLASGGVNQAIEWANRAIALDAESAEAWKLRGDAFLESGRTDDALSDLHRAVSYSPGDYTLLQSIAAIHHRRGQPQRCLTTTQLLIDLYTPGEEPSDILYLEGLALAQLGRHREASASLLAASQRGAPRADVLYALAEAYRQSGQPSEAVVAARNALAVDARHTKAIELLVELNPPARGSEAVRR